MQLFRTEAARLKGYLTRLGASRSFVDDIVQDSFLATRRRWASVRSYEKPAGYLYRVATNRMRRLHRITYARTEPCRPGRDHARCDERDPSDEVDQRVALELALRRQREAVLLHHVYGFRINMSPASS